MAAPPPGDLACGERSPARGPPKKRCAASFEEPVRPLTDAFGAASLETLPGFV